MPSLLSPNEYTSFLYIDPLPPPLRGETEDDPCHPGSDPAEDPLEWKRIDMSCSTATRCTFEPMICVGMSSQGEKGNDGGL